jgi:hypothetical protein
MKRHRAVEASSPNSRRRLMRGVFRSVNDLKAAINPFVAQNNADPKPFIWTADPRRVLAAVKRGKQALESVHSSVNLPVHRKDTHQTDNACYRSSRLLKNILETRSWISTGVLSSRNPNPIRTEGPTCAPAPCSQVAARSFHPAMSGALVSSAFSFATLSWGLLS